MKSNISLWLKIAAVTLCLIASLYPLISPLISYTSLDEEYAIYEASGDIITQTYPIDQCDSLQFFYADYISNKRTMFLNAIPNIKIVNDINFCVELTAESSIHDAISITVEDKTLVIDMQDQYYNRVHEDDTSYDYDSGLYVDCSVFDITIHAPIYTFRTNTQTVIDFDVPKTHELILDFSYEGTRADIHNIDVSDLNLYCSGNSDIALSGTVSGEANINLWHNTHVDARNLSVSNKDTFVSSSLFGSSRIKWSDTVEYNTSHRYNTSRTVILIVLTVFPVIWLCLDIIYIRRLVVSRDKNSPSPSPSQTQC